jgi:dipeptidyl aminopeptidase/acylaminoacyl peptidase
VLLSGVAAHHSLAADEKRLPEVDDGAKIRYPGTPQLSPSGDLIAFSEDGTLYVVSENRPEPRALTTESSSAWNPTWSADGEYLFFVSDRGDSSQVWKLPAGSFGEAAQVTRLEQGVDSVNLSPDESKLLLTFRDDAFEVDVSEDDSPPPPFVMTRRQFKRDAGQGYVTAGSTRHIYVYDIEDNALTTLTSGRFDDSSPAWSPDGESVVFVSNREAEPDASYRADIWMVSASGGEPVKLTDNESAKYGPVFSPDGKTIAYFTAGDGVYSVPHIALVPVVGGVPRVLTTSLDRWISGFEFSADGRWIYVNFDNAGGNHIARVRISDGRIERILEGDVTVGSFDVGPGSTLAVNLNTPNGTTDVHLLRGKKLTRLTDLNREFFAEILVGKQQKVSFQSRDGTTVEAFITTPPGYEPGRRYPTILNIHGGPVGQFAWGYSFRAQYLAANGYIVVEPNPRGSTGFGEEFVRAIFRTWGITDFDDVIASIDFAVEAGLADPDRLAVTGYSYGGYMTNVVITETDRFAAAASGAGHSLIEANFGHDIYQQWYMWELGVPWENREKYDRLSPFLRAGNVRTPTLFLGGRIDWNVPILNAELMYQALQVRGIDTELVVYPDSHHGGWHEDYEQDYQKRVVAWFDRYLKD